MLGDSIGARGLLARRSSDCSVFARPTSMRAYPCEPGMRENRSAYRSTLPIRPVPASCASCGRSVVPPPRRWEQAVNFERYWGELICSVCAEAFAEPIAKLLDDMDEEVPPWTRKHSGL